MTLYPVFPTDYNKPSLYSLLVYIVNTMHSHPHATGNIFAPTPSFPMRVTGGHRRGVQGSRSTAPSSAIPGGSVAAQRSYRTSGTLAPVFPVLGFA